MTLTFCIAATLLHASNTYCSISIIRRYLKMIRSIVDDRRKRLHPYVKRYNTPLWYPFLCIFFYLYLALRQIMLSSRSSCYNTMQDRDHSALFPSTHTRRVKAHNNNNNNNRVLEYTQIKDIKDTPPPISEQYCNISSTYNKL